MSFAGLVGNGMVIIAVKAVKKLRAIYTNQVLASLASADLLVCLLVMPANAVQLAVGKSENLLLTA